MVARPTSVRYPGMDDWQYMRSQQLAGPPLNEILHGIRSRTPLKGRVTVGAFNSFNVGEMDAALNGRRTGAASKYLVGGVDPATRPTQHFLLVEKLILGPYYGWGSPLDEILGTPSPVGTIDSRYTQIEPYLKAYRLVLTVGRPRNGPAVYLYVKR